MIVNSVTPEYQACPRKARDERGDNGIKDRERTSDGGYAKDLEALDNGYVKMCNIDRAIVYSIRCEYNGASFVARQIETR